MLADELFKKIWSLPPMPYRYEDENGNCRYPILGYADSYPTAIKRPNDYHRLLDEIINLYDKENLTDDDKKALATIMHRIQKRCAFTFDGYWSKERQKKLVDSLSNTALNDLCKQYEMYMDARKYYSKFF